jgi:hypothetical protein
MESGYKEEHKKEILVPISPETVSINGTNKLLALPVHILTEFHVTCKFCKKPIIVKDEENPKWDDYLSHIEEHISELWTVFTTEDKQKIMARNIVNQVNLRYILNNLSNIL